MARTTFSGPVKSENGFEGPFTATSVAFESDNGNKIDLDAPNALAANYTLVLPAADGTAGQVLTTDGAGALSFSTAAGSGDVVGPASATDNAVTRFDATTGKLIQNSLVTIADDGAIVAPEAGSVIPFYFANQAAFPSAATYHGAIAHSHADGAMYFAHAGVWLELANKADTADKLLFSIAADGTTDYVFTGSGIVAGNTNDPILYLYKGFTYTFVNTTGATHPFEIRVEAGGAAYTPGVSGSTTGTQTFEVPMNAPATLYYQCTNHSAMGNVINIV